MIITFCGHFHYSLNVYKHNKPYTNLYKGNYELYQTQFCKCLVYANTFKITITPEDKRMNIFHEKAEKNIVNECQDFINNNPSNELDYSVFRKALELYTKLSQSLLKSHKEFDEAVKNETEKIVFMEEGTEKDSAIYKFAQQNYCLYLDVEAHRILGQLVMIQQQNKGNK